VLENIFLFLTTLSPKLKRRLWRWWYQLLASNYQKPDFKFMNYGFDDLHGELGEVRLFPEDEVDRYYIQLYHYVAAQANLEQQNVLEIGCGRGGGSHYIAKYLRPDAIVGLDFSSQNIAVANHIYDLPNLSFQTGDAEALPFADHTFDVIINVESSHCYGSMEKFLQEVHRVLKPGGIFSWADLVSYGDQPKLEQAFAHSGLKQLKFQEITPHVLNALDRANDQKLNFINAHTPRFLSHVIREFAGMKEGKIYRAFQTKTVVYLSSVWRKG
jgi:ubiquinone/menaquinone biosynthesis C-methylase UbiE